VVASIFLLYRLELVFADSADWAYPIVGKVGERSAGFYAIVRVTYGRVVNPVANFTYIFFHSAF